MEGGREVETEERGRGWGLKKGALLSRSVCSCDVRYRCGQ